MSGWVSSWAAPVYTCVPGYLSIVNYMVLPRCAEDFMGALGMGSPTGAPRGLNFRDVRLADIDHNLQAARVASQAKLPT